MKIWHIQTHKDRLSGNSVQNINYSPNNRICGFRLIYYLGFKKSPVLLIQRNFFSKYACKESQYHFVNLNYAKLQDERTAVSFFVVDGAHFQFNCCHIVYCSMKAWNNRWQFIFRVVNLFLMCVSRIKCQVHQDKGHFLKWIIICKD